MKNNGPHARETTAGRSSFWLCLIAGFLLAGMAALGAVEYALTDGNLFRQAVVKYVDLEGLGVSAGDGESFAAMTIAYLRGDLSQWSPAISMGGKPMPIPAAFAAHMASVRGGVALGRTLLLIGIPLALCLLAAALLGRVGKARLSFSVRGYYLGAAIPLCALAALGGWACADFDSLWAWLHATFIPDGIFSAAEPIMQLFPITLFQAYLAPVGVAFGIFLGIALALPAALSPLSRRAS